MDAKGESESEKAVSRRRERVGDPPTPEEMVAWSRGEWPEEDADRMRERLACYPDLAAALSEDDALEDEAPTLSREQLADDWEILQQRLHQPKVAAVVAATNPSSSKRWLVILPTITTLLFAGLWGRSLLTIDTLREELGRPKENVEQLNLYADSASRGPGSPTLVALDPSTEHVVLTLDRPAEPGTGARHRIEIRDLNGSQPVVVWTSNAGRARNGAFSIEVPRRFLTSHSYEIRLYAEGRPDPIATYTIFLASRR